MQSNPISLPSITPEKYRVFSVFTSHLAASVAVVITAFVLVSVILLIECRRTTTRKRWKPPSTCE